MAVFKLKGQNYIFIGAFFALLILYFVLPGSEEVRAAIIAGVGIASIALYIFLVERAYKKKPAPTEKGLKMGAVKVDGSRLKQLFSEWQWIPTASILGVVGFIGFALFKLALWPVIYMMIMSFVGFGLIEYARISKK